MLAVRLETRLLLRVPAADTMPDVRTMGGPPAMKAGAVRRGVVKPGVPLGQKKSSRYFARFTAQTQPFQRATSQQYPFAAKIDTHRTGLSNVGTHWGNPIPHGELRRRRLGLLTGSVCPPAPCARRLLRLYRRRALPSR